MTTAMRSDIEQALAEALHAKRLHHGRGGADADLAKTGCEQQGLEPCRRLVRLFMSLEPMQAIARQAAIGAAVERLQREATSWRIVGSTYDKGVRVTDYGDPPRSAVADTLIAATTAALGDDDE